ncbi:MAG: 2-C-methyl-D-erythritol 2,4-cyclodiphosphate synthase [Clostridiales bacterium]|nr:2-C-methyl-D-erythritol 2,4-cyclodiphosphate synthase [Clostridiales bacterium]
MSSETDFPALPKNITVGAVIVCAGKGTRTGLSYNKILYHLGQKTVLETVLDKFADSLVSSVTLVISADDEPAIKTLTEPYKNVSLTYGGKTRTESVINGLKSTSCDIVVIHDGARPFVRPETINASIMSAVTYGSGITAVPAVDTIKHVRSSQIVGSLDRSELYNVQTPQTFRYKEIVDAYQKVSGVFTDDSEVYARAGYTPHIVVGEYDNIKITNETDLTRVLPDDVKIGVGYDAHKTVDGRPLILGGVTIPHSKGLLGHSDADALTHAVMDAVLSAAGLPDIGVLFPDNDPALSGISSMILLDKVLEKIKNEGMYITNVSAVIMAQEPKMAPHISAIRGSLAKRMNISVGRVNVSATTTENMGVIAGGKAIACSASCLLSKRQ